MGLSNDLSCEAGSLSHCRLKPHRCFQSEALRFYFFSLEPWVAQSVSLPSCSSGFICTPMWDHPICNPPPCQVSSLLGCPSPPLLPVWMNVSSLTPWLSYFHAVRFSGSSGCFLFLNLLLSFFWLCEEAQCIHLHLHIGQKSRSIWFFEVIISFFSCRVELREK